MSVRNDHISVDSKEENSKASETILSLLVIIVTLFWLHTPIVFLPISV